MPKHVLIIDDDEDITDALALILEDEGYTHAIANTQTQIYPAIDHHLPDLILLDVLLSGFDGRDVCHKLKNDPTTQAIPIIMISAHPNVEKDAMACGAEIFLAKPFQLDRLLTVIDGCLES